jgi:hypothetical protein
MASHMYIQFAHAGFKLPLAVLVDLHRERRKLQKLCTGDDAVTCPNCAWIGPPHKLPFHRREHV